MAMCFACSGHGKVSKKPAKPSKVEMLLLSGSGSAGTLAIAMRQLKMQALKKAVADFNKRKHAPFFNDTMGVETITVKYMKPNSKGLPPPQEIQNGLRYLF
jgi:hypothetical protein